MLKRNSLNQMQKSCVELGQNLIFWSSFVLSESDVLSYQNLMKFPTVGKLALPHFTDKLELQFVCCRVVGIA